MSKMTEMNLKPDERTLRQFGFIAFFGFGLVAALAWFELLIFSFGLGEAKQWVAGGFGALAVVSMLLSLVFPKANLPIYLGLTIVSFPIGFVLSYVIMGTLFYLLITPVALFFKVTGRDTMNRRFEPEAETYWIPVARERSKESYFKQF
jgi:MFS family permease